jgi:NAD(P)-dependent dehydrogenase (short-subunit alcohol dehydrogenase family)
MLTQAFVPLFKAAQSPRVVNVSSARGSVGRVTGSVNPPTASIPYSISKTALNLMIFEMAKLEPDIVFYTTSPGHTKTAFNGFRGTKDPLDAAKVVEELLLANDGAFKSGFWEFESGGMHEIPW